MNTGVKLLAIVVVVDYYIIIIIILQHNNPAWVLAFSTRLFHSIIIIMQL